MRWTEFTHLLAAAMLAASLPLFAADLPPVIDAHAHYSAEDAAALPPPAIIAQLDKAGVRRLVAIGFPPELAQDLYRYAPERIIPFLGVYESGTTKADWMHDAALPGKAAAWLKSGNWAGLGELHLFTRDAGSPVFAELTKLAETNNLVLMLHGDAAVIDRAFELAPELRVLWAHLGTEPVPETLAAMLERHRGRLWIDTSVRDERIAPGGKLLPAWRALFLRYPDSFLAAVDTFSLNRWQHYGEVAHEIRTWASALPQEVQRKLLHDNAAQLFETFLSRQVRPDTMPQIEKD